MQSRSDKPEGRELMAALPTEPTLIAPELLESLTDSDSPRGALALLDCARTWALMNQRSHVVPEDLQMVLPPVAAHRLIPSGDYAGDGLALVTLLLRSVDVVKP